MAMFKIERVDNRRPCMTKDGKKCFFHCWNHESNIVGPSLLKGGHSGGVVSGVLGILEFEDGSIKKMSIEKFKFVDGGGFEDYAWPGEEEPIEEVKGCRYSLCKFYADNFVLQGELCAGCMLGNPLSLNEVCKDFEP